MCMKSADLEFSLIDRQYVLGDFSVYKLLKFYLLVLPGFKSSESHTALLPGRLLNTISSFLNFGNC